MSDWQRIERLKAPGLHLSREQKRAVLLGSEMGVTGARESGVVGSTMKALSARGLAVVWVQRRSPAAYDRFVYRLTQAGVELRMRWIVEDDERQRATGFTNGSVAEAAARTIVAGLQAAGR